jgi:hypothetical protein
LRTNIKFGDWSLEGARLQAAPYIVFKDLRHGSEAVPFQNSDAGSFSASSLNAKTKKHQPLVELVLEVAGKFA